MIIDIDLPLKISTNEIYGGKHWKKRKDDAEHFHSLLYEHKDEQIPDSDFPVHLTFVFTFKGRALDWSNCSYMAKMLEDGMIHMGMIPNDSPKYVSGGTIITQRGDKDSVKIIAVNDKQFYEAYRR